MGHHHSHDHDHHHHHHGDSFSALMWALALNGGFLVIEAAAGWVTGSLALLSDAAHMVSDVGALLLAVGAAWLASQKPTLERTFGLRRAEVLGGFLNAVSVLVVCVWIVWEASKRLLGGAPEVPGTTVLVVGLIGLAINLGSAFFLWRSGKENLNVQGALVHMLADALGSVGAVVAALGMMAGFPIADPIASLLIAALVVWATWGLLRQTSRVLLQLPPPGFDVSAMRAAVEAEEGVLSMHDPHVWTLDGQEPIVTAHVVASADSDLDAVRGRVAALLKERFGAHHCTLQVESASAPCVGPDCLGERAVG